MSEKLWDERYVPTYILKKYDIFYRFVDNENGQSVIEVHGILSYHSSGSHIVNLNG